MKKSFDLKEVARHCTKSDFWVVFEGKVLDLSNFLSEHPGGEEVILDYAGKDVSQAFEDIGHSYHAIELMDRYVIGKLAEAPRSNEPTKNMSPPIINEIACAIDQRNWEELATLVYQNPNVLFWTNDTLNPTQSLETTIFASKIAVQALKSLADNNGAKKIQLVAVLDQSMTNKLIIKEEIATLETRLNILKKQLCEANETVNSTAKQFVDVENSLLQAQTSLISCQQFLAEKEMLQNKWQEKLQLDISKWTTDDIIFLLKELSLDQYENAFRINLIDGSVLEQLETTDLMAALGLSFKDAKRLLLNIYLVQEHKDIYKVPVGVLQWTTDTVCTWLEDNKFGHLVGNFKAKEITGAELPFLDKADLTTQLQIKALGDVIKLQKEISLLKASLLDGQRTQNFSEKDSTSMNIQAEQKLAEMQVFNEELKRTLNDFKTKVPEAFTCPITQDIMTDPVFTSDGHSYERVAIEAWLERHNTSPVTNLPLANKQLTPSHTLKSMISEFIERNRK